VCPAFSLHPEIPPKRIALMLPAKEAQQVRDGRSMGTWVTLLFSDGFTKLTPPNNLNHRLYSEKHCTCCLDSKQHLQALWLPTTPKHSRQTPLFRRGTVTKPPALLLQRGDITRAYVPHANNTLMPRTEANAHASYFLPVRCRKIVPINNEKGCVTKTRFQGLKGQNGGCLFTGFGWGWVQPAVIYFLAFFIALQNQGKKWSESHQPILFLIFPTPQYPKEAEKGGTVWCRAKALHVKPPLRGRSLHRSITGVVAASTGGAFTPELPAPAPLPAPVPAGGAKHRAPQVPPVSGTRWGCGSGLGKPPTGPGHCHVEGPSRKSSAQPGGEHRGASRSSGCRPRAGLKAVSLPAANTHTSRLLEHQHA